ncbi:ANTAR domain-containing protein [Streptomyces sp. NPDC048384]|uniref:ANTAR domain-containing protein n=1 Tax=Streptomyces sp. NPDC048384 TaxID=3155487 RepID=UPI003443BB92
MLLAPWSCTQEEAWQILVRASQHANTKLHDVAEAEVATTQQTPMPADLQDHLALILTIWRAHRARGGWRAGVSGNRLGTDDS